MKYNLGDNLTAKIKSRLRNFTNTGSFGVWEWEVWEGDEMINRGSYLHSARFCCIADVVDRLKFRYIDEPNMVCGGEDGPSDADSGL